MSLLACGGGDAPTTAASSSGTGGGAGEGGAGGQGGEGERDCWLTKPTEWLSVEPMDTTQLAGQTLRDPMLAADGLSLYYTAQENLAAPHRVYRATRVSRDAPFQGGESLGSWAGIEPVAHPWVADNQLFLNLDDGLGGFRVAVSLFVGSAWGFPVPLEATVNDPLTVANSDPTASADARRVVFSRSEQGGLDLKLFEAARPEGLAHEPFASVTLLQIPEIEAGDVVICPALSPDGLRLFFSTTHPIDLSGGVPPGALTVWFSERVSVEQPWQAPVHIEAFDSPTHQTCIHAVRGDGCEAIVERFQIGATDAAVFDRAQR